MTEINPAAVGGISPETQRTSVTQDAGGVGESTSVTLGRTVATRPEGTAAAEHVRILEEIGAAADARRAQEASDPTPAKDVRVESRPAPEAEEVAEAAVPSGSQRMRLKHYLK